MTVENQIRRIQTDKSFLLKLIIASDWQRVRDNLKRLNVTGANNVINSDTAFETISRLNVTNRNIAKAALNNVRYRSNSGTFADGYSQAMSTFKFNWNNFLDGLLDGLASGFTPDNTAANTAGSGGNNPDNNNNDDDKDKNKIGLYIFLGVLGLLLIIGIIALIARSNKNKIGSGSGLMDVNETRTTTVKTNRQNPDFK